MFTTGPYFEEPQIDDEGYNLKPHSSKGVLGWEAIGRFFNADPQNQK